jgi:hypothetical protein
VLEEAGLSTQEIDRIIVGAGTPRPNQETESS